MNPRYNRSGDNNINDNGVIRVLEQEDNDSVISIRDLLYSVIRRLGIILLVAVVIGGVLFSYKLIQRSRSSNVLDSSTRLSDSESDYQYQLRVQKIGRARDIVYTIDKINAQIENQRHYLTDSVFMQIDAENEYQSTAQIVLTLENNDTNGLDTALFSAYEREIKSGNYLSEYADKTGTKHDYIKELITFSSTPAGSTIISLDNDVDRAGSMYISILGPSKEFVDEVTDIVLKEIENVCSELNVSVAPHKISVVGIQQVIKIDQTTREGQVTQTARLETLQKQIVTYNESLDKIAGELGLSDKEELLVYFAENAGAGNGAGSSGTNVNSISVMSMVKPAVKFGAIGFLAGVFIMAVFFILKYVFGKKIITQAQFFSIFNVRKIGVMKPSGKRSGFASFIDVKTGDDTAIGKEDYLKLIGANYANITRSYGKILITGTCDPKAMGDAVKALGLKGDLKPGIHKDPDVLKAVTDYDGIVLLEQRNVSLKKDIEGEISLIDNSGTEIIGAVIL
ncbi:MAG: hypothetical protein K6E72_01840 [Saccharofermentans sp.]|nr:hypothetical protein [Saccharofermentans sp.]